MPRDDQDSERDGCQACVESSPTGAW